MIELRWSLFVENNNLSKEINYKIHINLDLNFISKKSNV